MATSAVPAALDALLAILRAATRLTDVQIIDGPAVGDLATGDVMWVGWQPGGDLAADITQTFASAGARRRDEEFDIAGYLESAVGDADVSAARTRAFAMLAALEDALRSTDAEPDAATLRGTVLWAHLTAGVVAQGRTGDGVRVGIAWRVSCHARL